MIEWFHLKDLIPAEAIFAADILFPVAFFPMTDSVLSLPRIVQFHFLNRFTAAKTAMNTIVIVALAGVSA